MGSIPTPATNLEKENIMSKIKLKDLSREEFELLKASGMMWELYPDAPDVYEDIAVIE